MINNISPEDILKQKELLGGVQYDDPVKEPELPKVKETGIKQVVREMDPIPTPPPQSMPQDSAKPKRDSLGHVAMGQASSEIGWKNLPLQILPSKGLFYPEGTRIAIRAAEVREIRYFSTIDDEDRLDIEDKLNYILDRCTRMEFPGEGVVTYKDLKQEDRFFIIMAIRDLTFVRGENSIFLKPFKSCKETPDCPFTQGIELRTGALSSYEIDPKIMSYYNSGTRSFIFEIKKTGKKIALHVPSIGITQAISSFVINQTRNGNPPDDGFIKIAPFLFADWRGHTDSSILNKMREIDYWSKEEYSLVFELTEKIRIGTELQVKQNCPVCGGMEVTAEISFPSGLRSLFVISDIFGELL